MSPIVSGYRSPRPGGIVLEEMARNPNGNNEPAKIPAVFATPEPAMSSLPVITPYELLGGESALKELVQRFYGYMDTLPDAAGIRAMHAEDLGGAKDKLFKFLSGWMGGPQLFWQEFGHPRLRMRHLPFSIGIAERDQWMKCMEMALNDMAMDANLRDALLEAFGHTATHMINRDG